MTLTTQTNNNSLQVISDVICLNPENEDKTNFLIENNSKLINEIDPNDISDIMPLENKNLDYKINIYNNNSISKAEDKKNNNNSSDDEEGESIINHFDIINNQMQNESKEIKLSQIKNNDNSNSNSNMNISITNLSKLTNFVDSNIKYGELSHISNKINNKNIDIKKNINNKMEIIKESLLNSNDNNNNTEEKLEKKPEINIKRIEHKKVKKSTTKQIDKNKNNYDEAKNSNISKDFEEKTINNEDNDNYFYINEEKKKIGNKKINNKIITFEKEPKDNYMNKNIALMNKEFKHKFNSANISSSS
jgi:hypothetical protein